MRNYVRFYLNGEAQTVKGEDAFLQMSDYLRYVRHLTGTKIVCAEGNCGSCTVMRALPLNANKLDFVAVNSCIAPVYLFDGCHVVTVEGLKTANNLHPIQNSMVQNCGAQCGYCTSGFVMAITNLFEQKQSVTEKHVKNYLTGNLCRCTGYFDIINSAMAVDPLQITYLRDQYFTGDSLKDLHEHHKVSVSIEFESLRLFIPTNLNEALRYKAERHHSRIVSGATDLGVQANKDRIDLDDVMSLNLIEELYPIENNKNEVVIGAKASLARIQDATSDSLSDLSHFLNIFASPQIKNHGTLSGNIINASPIADTIPVLMIHDSRVEFASQSGVREVPLEKLYLGYKKLDLKAYEFLTKIIIPRVSENSFVRAYKVSQRRDLDISGLNAAFLIRTDQNSVMDFRLSLGGVGPVTVRLRNTEALLKGKKVNNSKLSDELVSQIKKSILTEIIPFSDLRGSKEFRQILALNLFDKFLAEWNSDVR